MTEESKKQIIVEGEADEKFLKDYMNFLKIEENCRVIDILKGNMETERLKLLVGKGGFKKENIIVIIDSDSNEDKKNYQKIIKAQEIPQENVFFFPDNEKMGNLESLLEKILVNEDFGKCYRAYQDCLENKKLKKFDKKAFLYSYDFSTGGDGKETDRNYSEKKRYNLFHKDLDSLKKFLEKHLKKE